MVWQNTVALPTRGSNIFALAMFAHKQRVPAKVIVESPEYSSPIKGYNKSEIELASFVSSSFRDRAKRMGIMIEERDFNVQEIIDLLVRSKKILLLRLEASTSRGRAILEKMR